MDNRERPRASGDQFRWKENVKLYSGVEKMRNSSGFQGENMSGGEESKVNGSTDISSIKRVTRKLKEVSLFSRAKQRQGNVQKVCCTCKGFFFFCTD